MVANGFALQAHLEIISRATDAVLPSLVRPITSLYPDRSQCCLRFMIKYRPCRKLIYRGGARREVQRLNTA